ncbi:hypothetical protein [Pseudomonas aeruginosa]|uniref:hypothetical protein n=1 Tax=Pseudomonas aeruginosa TaxID=287 RepID=UPI0013C4731D|nr:hypothetical protein [Pseudomonas aeruginosa]
MIGWRERILAAHPSSDPGFWPDALLVEHMAAEIADLRAALARVEELERKLRDEENAHTTTIEQRDNAEHWADQLAKAIAERFGVDIGEHSNLNCPWNEALVWMQQPPAQAQHSVPDGWRIERSAERIVVMNLNNGAGYAAARNGESGIAESVLYLLAADLLAAAPGKEGV